MYSPWQNSNFLAVQDLQSYSQILSQVGIHWSTMDQRKCRVHCLLRSVAQLAILYDNALSYSLTVQCRTIRPSLLRFAALPWRLGQRADCPRPLRALTRQSRWASADRGPRATGQRGSPTAVVDGHCHLPPGADSLHSLRRPNGPESVGVSHAYSSLVNSTDMLAMANGGNGSLAHLD